MLSRLRMGETAAICRQVTERAEAGDLPGAIARGQAANRTLHDPALERPPRRGSSFPSFVDET